MKNIFIIYLLSVSVSYSQIKQVYSLTPNLTALNINSASGIGGNTWRVWSDNTTNYYAQQSITGQSITTNDFSALMQQIDTLSSSHYYVHIAGNPVFQSAYFVTNTIILTNSAIIQGDGNPSTVLFGVSALNGPIFQVGTISSALFSLSCFRDLRFDGANAGSSGVGIKFINSPEPVIERCEFTKFKLAGIQINSTNANFYSYINSSFFVMDNDANGIGVLFDREVLDPNNVECLINNCFFGCGLGRGIVVSNRFRSLSIQASRFMWVNPFSTGIKGIQLFAGESYNISGNTFPVWPTGVSPIRFEDRTVVTNYPSVVSGNSTWSSAAPATNLVYIGTNIQGVISIGNNNQFGGTASFYAATNGPIWQFDTSGLRVGSSNTLAITNIYTASATLDFASQSVGGLEDLPITVNGAASGDVVQVSPPQGSATGIIGTFSGYASNNTVYVRFISNAAIQNPASGIYKVIVKKF
jgi:hypothetical protein